MGERKLQKEVLCIKRPGTAKNVTGVNHMSYFLLVIGFLLLVKGADWFVSGSSAIAAHFHIPSFVIGLTIVACGTSLPEAAISISAALKGANGILVGNALGSNMMNLLVVLGASALVRPCPITASTLYFEYPLSILAAVFLLSLSAGSSGLYFSRIDGIILLVIFVMFLSSTVKRAARGRRDVPLEQDVKPAAEIEREAELGPAKRPLARHIAMSVLGAAAIILGGDLAVDAATEIASSLGIDETLIGLTVVALGTSLPELVTGVVAAVKGETDIAVGNVIGSNIFNLLFVLGLSITIHPIRTTALTVYDTMVLIAASLIVLIPLTRRRELDRRWGAGMLVMYGVYLAYIILRSV